MVRKPADTHIYICGNEEVPEGQIDCVHTNIKRFASAKPHWISQEFTDVQQSIHILLVQSGSPLDLRTLALSEVLHSCFPLTHIPVPARTHLNAWRVS